jgi:hypothetical protein
VVKSILYCDTELIDRIPQEDLPLYMNFKFHGAIYEYFTRRLQGEDIK